MIAFEAIALNGSFNGPGPIREGRYHLSFNAKSGHMYERCVDDLVRFVSEAGEPWFKRFSVLDALLNAKDSPLKDIQRQLLVSARIGDANPANEAASLKLVCLT